LDVARGNKIENLIVLGYPMVVIRKILLALVGDYTKLPPIASQITLLSSQFDDIYPIFIFFVI